MPRQWGGNLQYTDTKSQTLTMLPTDIAIKTDPKFRPIAESYAKDEAAFFRDFSRAFAKLVALGCPANTQPKDTSSGPAGKCPSAEFREMAMHGSLEHMDSVLAAHPKLNKHSADAGSNRTALHKGACSNLATHDAAQKASRPLRLLRPFAPACAGTS